MLEIISTNRAPQAIGPYSQAIAIHGLVYTSGQIGLNAQGELVAGGIKEQTTQVLKNLEALLEESGSSFSQVIKTTIFLTDMEHFAIVNEIYGSFFDAHHPARSTIAVKALPKNALVEIECVALRA